MDPTPCLTTSRESSSSAPVLSLSNLAISSSVSMPNKYALSVPAALTETVHERANTTTSARVHVRRPTTCLLLLSDILMRATSSVLVESSQGNLDNMGFPIAQSRQKIAFDFTSVQSHLGDS